MNVSLESVLRCPLDPARQSPLVREGQELVCTCGTRFDVKKGVPILLAGQAELPCAKPEQLPCRQKRK